jgi:hypothetical protein
MQKSGPHLRAAITGATRHAHFVPQGDLSNCSKQVVYWMAFPTSTIRGTRIVKVEPWPGSLSTIMSPPII